jgi:phosphocarrier protein
VQVKEIECVIRNQMGLHVRSASKLSKVASKFKAEIFVSYGGLEVNAKSVLGVMMLAAEEGATIKFRAEGADEDQALAALKDLVDGKFGGEP